MSEVWDVESYRTDFESEEHWELRKSFMLAHKDRLPEDEIVCLAQVFVNIELLGCRYPDETMRKVAELAKGIVESYREKKKDCLKRTFVAASDAAASKVKGSSSKCKFSSLRLNTGVNGGRKFENVKKMRVVDKNVQRYEPHNFNRVRSNECYDFSGQPSFRSNPDRKRRRGASKNVMSSNDAHKLNIKKPEGPFADVVLFVNDDHPANLLERNASLNKCAVSWKYDSETNSTVCSVYLNDNLVATGEGKNKKVARELAGREAIQKLQSLCYTIKIKARFASDSTISPAELSSSAPVGTAEKCSVGEQIMKLMGWKGGGLGPRQEGIVDPVSLLSNSGRSGLGNYNGNDPEFKKRARSLIQKWIQSNTDQDLVFTSEFSCEQRKTLHELAKMFSLKSKSYGKGDDRHLVVSRNPSPWKIVEELMKVGGNTSKYELIVPGAPK